MRRVVGHLAVALGVVVLPACDSVDSLVGAMGSGGTRSGAGGETETNGGAEASGGERSNGGIPTIAGGRRPAEAGSGSAGGPGGGSDAGGGSGMGGSSIGGALGTDGSLGQPTPHWLAFSNEQGVFVYDVRTFPATDSSVRLAGPQKSPGPVQWSPDGRTLLYRDSLDLFLVSLRSDTPSAPRLLLHGLPIFALEWSADSNSVAITTDYGLAVFAPHDAPPILHTVTAGDGISFQWAPAGNRLLYAHTGEPQHVATIEAGVPSNPIVTSLEAAVWSPDGRRLAGNSAAGTALVTLDATSARTQILAQEAAPSLSFSPDSQKLAAQLQTQEQLSARYFDLTQAAASAVHVGASLDIWDTEVVGLASVAPWSPDSQSLALLVQGFETRFFAQSVAVGAPIPVNGRMSQVSWSPNRERPALIGLRSVVEGANDLVRLDTSKADAKPQWLYASQGPDLLVDYALDPSGSRAIARSPTILHLADLNHPGETAVELPIRSYRRFSSDHQLAPAAWSPDGRFLAMADSDAQPHVIRFDGVKSVEEVNWPGVGEFASYAWQPGKAELTPVEATPAAGATKVNCDGRAVGTQSLQRDMSVYRLERKLSDITTISELKDFCQDLAGLDDAHPDIAVADCLLDLAYQGVDCGASLADYVAYVRRHDCSGLESVCPGILAPNDPPRDDEVTREGPAGLSIKGQLQGQSFSLLTGREGGLSGYGSDGIFQTAGYWDASSYMLWGSIVSKHYEAILRLGPLDMAGTRLICVGEAHAAFEKEATYPTVSRKLGLFDGANLSELACGGQGGSAVDLTYSDQGSSGGTLHGAAVTGVKMLPLRCAGELCYVELTVLDAAGTSSMASTLVLSVEAIAEPVASENGSVDEIEQRFTSSHLIETDGHGQVSCGSGGTVRQRRVHSVAGEDAVDLVVHVDSLKAPSTCPGAPLEGSLKGASNFF